MALYEVALLGTPTKAQLDAFNSNLIKAAESFQLSIGDEISIQVNPEKFIPNSRSASAVIFYSVMAARR